jgi:hypothetical protein
LFDRHQEARKQEFYMTEEEKQLAIREINLKNSALLEGRKKLRKRRDLIRTLPDPDQHSKLVMIEVGLVRLRMKTRQLLNLKDAIKENQKSIPPPTVEQINSMKIKVEAIANINVNNQNAREIANAVVVIAGALQSDDIV